MTYRKRFVCVKSLSDAKKKKDKKKREGAIHREKGFHSECLTIINTDIKIFFLTTPMLFFY